MTPEIKKALSDQFDYILFPDSNRAANGCATLWRERMFRMFVACWERDERVDGDRLSRFIHAEWAPCRRSLSLCHYRTIHEICTAWNEWAYARKKLVLDDD